MPKQLLSDVYIKTGFQRNYTKTNDSEVIIAIRQIIPM